MQLLIFSAEERPASPSATPDSELDWMTRVVNSCSPLVPLLQGIGPAGWFGRTSPASCQATEDGTLVPSSGCWASSGMGSPTAFWTLSLCEWTATGVPSHSDGSVCSLSDVLETGAVPQRYFLSAKACAGILRRAEARGRALPHALEQALQTVAQHPVPFDTTQITSASNYSNPKAGDPCHPLAAGAHAPAVAFGWQNAAAQGMAVDTISPALDKSKTPATQHAAAVRRLMPVECERLMGFPDGYTLVPFRGKPAADGNRYKALGNSWAVNCARWIGWRISLVDSLASRCAVGVEA